MVTIKKNMIGDTGLQVTEFCLGILPMGPLQADIPEKEAVKIISSAAEYGVNFIDTAEGYKTQPYVGKAIGGNRDEYVIATKSPAKSYEDMEHSVKKSLKELGRDYIDIYHLHAARSSIEVFQEREGALKCLVDMKQQGYIRAVGISTHSVAVTNEAADMSEIDIIFPLLNPEGLGIGDGSAEDMIKAIAKANTAGKGLYAMKVLGGGNFLNDIKKRIEWGLDIEGISSVSIGVTTIEELHYNLSLMGVEQLKGTPVPDITRNKRLHILDRHCIGCGACVEACPNYALSIQNDVAVVDHSKCILCGYCSPECPQFIIRVV